MNEIFIAGAFTIIGAALGFLGTLIQSKISAKSNIAMVKIQSQKEIERHRYLEKEKLYSDIIGWLPQLALAVDFATQKINLSDSDKLQFNSFKARLNIYSSPEICAEFYKLTALLCTEKDEKKRADAMTDFTPVLIKDLKD